MSKLVSIPVKCLGGPLHGRTQGIKFWVSEVPKEDHISPEKRIVIFNVKLRTMFDDEGEVAKKRIVARDYIYTVESIQGENRKRFFFLQYEKYSINDSLAALVYGSRKMIESGYKEFSLTDDYFFNEDDRGGINDHS